MSAFTTPPSLNPKPIPDVVTERVVLMIDSCPLEGWDEMLPNRAPEIVIIFLEFRWWSALQLSCPCGWDMCDQCQRCEYLNERVCEELINLAATRITRFPRTDTEATVTLVGVDDFIDFTAGYVGPTPRLRLLNWIVHESKVDPAKITTMAKFATLAEYRERVGEKRFELETTTTIKELDVAGDGSSGADTQEVDRDDDDKDDNGSE